MAQVKLFVMLKKIPLQFVVLILLMQACTEQTKVKEVNTENVKFILKINRFEDDFMGPKHLSIKQLYQKYPSFLPLYTQEIIALNKTQDSLSAKDFEDFISDQYVKELYHDVKKQFPTLQSFKPQLEDAWKHYKAFFPHKAIPEVLTFISGFGYQVVAADSTMAISLDMYLGPNYAHYNDLQVPKYRSRKFSPEYISADCMKGWAQSEYTLEEKRRNTLLDHMIYNGKIWYFTKAMLPDVNDTLISGYSQAQEDWCTKNEKSIWNYFTSQKLLYNSNYQEFFKLISEGPTTNGLPKESPGQLGYWLGLQIVMDYMEKNPAVSLEQLMNETDSQKILKLSNYKPAK